MITLNDKEFADLSGYVLSNYGIDLSKKKMLIQGRLSHVVLQKGMHSFDEYIQYVINDKSGMEVQQMLNRLTTNITYFMREKEHFDFVSKVALPELVKKAGGKALRVWSAGCSSGEEPYTLAMILSDYYESCGRKPNFELLASDISHQVLKQALLGVYSEQALKDMPTTWKQKYFVPLDSGDYQVCQAIRDKVTYRIFNLMDPFHFKAPFEIIFCRNVMIYFEKTKKEELIDKFFQWTSPGGYFFISHSENIGRSNHEFKTVRPSAFFKES